MLAATAAQKHLGHQGACPSNRWAATEWF